MTDPHPTDPGVRPVAALSSHNWFPDFCRLPTLFSLMVLSELVVILLEIGAGGSREVLIDRLSLSSAFAQWLAIMLALVLCSSRGLLNRLPVVAGLLLALMIIVLLTAMLTGIGIGLLRMINGGTIDITEIAGPMLRNALIAALVALATGRYFYIQQRWRSQVEQLAEARVQALQARIRPHFLFNSMNTIASLIHSNPDVAEQCVEDLSELFRAALASLDQTTTLEQELMLCRQYLQIEALRLGDRFSLDWPEDDDVPDIRLPPLTLQPLFENAIYHGISQLSQPGCIEVRSERDDQGWTLHIINPLPEHSITDHNSGHQIAMSNIRQRLAHFFGNRARLETGLRGARFHATMRLPSTTQQRL